MTAVDGTNVCSAGQEALEYALHDLPQMVPSALRDLAPHQLIRLAKSASFVKQCAEDALGRSA